jgi:transposase-like protein
MSQPIPLTLKQQFWLEHLRACERSGQTMKDYAQHHDLSIGTFYAWKKTLRRKGALGTYLSAAPSLFQKVALQNHSGALRLVLPTGLSLEIAAGTDPRWVAQLIGALS